MERFTYTNKLGNSVTIGYGEEDFTLLNYDGLTSAEVIPATNKGYRQYGNNVQFLGIGSRVIDINFLDCASTLQEGYERRRTLASVFNPIYLGTLRYENDFGAYCLEDVEVSIQPSPTKRMGLLQEYTVELTAHNPFFRSVAIQTYHLTKNNLLVVNYDGDIPAPYIITFMCNSEVLQPTLRHQYNGSLEVLTEANIGMLVGDVSVPGSASYQRQFSVCTAYGKKGTNSLDPINLPDGMPNFNSNWTGQDLLASQTRFRDINVGENWFWAYCNKGTPQDIILRFYKWYSGV